MENVIKIKTADIEPELFETRRFRSTKQTPNSERYKNQNSYRLMMMTEGKATLKLRGEESVIEENDCLYLVPGERYRILNTHGDFEVLNIWFDYLRGRAKVQSFNTVFDDEFDKKLSVDRCDIYEAHELLKSVAVKKNPRMRALAENLNGLRQSGGICSEMQIKAGLFNLISQLVTSVKSSKDTGKSVGEIIDYIQRHITEKITADELSERFHYHKNHIGKLIKNATGLTLKQYIIREKIAYAKQLMRETNLSMTEIASALSFYDYSHFCKYFKDDQFK